MSTELGRVWVRPMAAADVEAVAHLCGELGYSCARADVAGRVAAVGNVDRARLLVAEEDGTIAGWLHVEVRTTLMSGAVGEIMGLVVTEARRGRGVGRALVTRAEAWLRSQDCDAIRVRSNVTRDDAREFYARCGYRVVKQQRVFEKEI